MQRAITVCYCTSNILIQISLCDKFSALKQNMDMRDDFDTFDIQHVDACITNTMKHILLVFQRIL